MLRKNLRLLSFSSKNQSLLSTQNFNLKISENGTGENKFGFLVSKKVDTRAVVRNRAKRIIRRVVEENFLKINKGYDFLFVLKKNIVGKKKEDVEKEVLDLLRENKLYA